MSSGCASGGRSDLHPSPRSLSDSRNSEQEVPPTRARPSVRKEKKGFKNEKREEWIWGDECVVWGLPVRTLTA